MRFHTARLSLPAVVRWKSEWMIITVSVWSSSYFVLYSTIAFFSSLSLAYIYYLNIPYFFNKYLFNKKQWNQMKIKINPQNQNLYSGGSISL